MITILHGENIVASRKQLSDKIAQAKDKGVAEVIRLDGKKVELSEVKQSLESSSLFGGERLVVIEGLLSRPKSKALDEITNYLINQLPIANFQLILWEGKSLSSSQIKKFQSSKVKISEFKPSAVIFNLTDAIRPNNTQQLISLLAECVKLDSAEMVFYMLSRQIRLLLQSESNEFKMAPWQLNKLRIQSEKLRKDRILWIHNQLLEIDERIKTGQSALGLQGELELMLVSI